MSLFFYFFLFLFLFLCILLIFIILMQESKSMGLGASFGGDAGESLFGTSTAAVLKKVTAYLAGIFLMSCILLSLWTATIGRSQLVKQPTVIEKKTSNRVQDEESS